MSAAVGRCEEAKYEHLEKSLHTDFLFGVTSTNHSFAGTFRGWCRKIQKQNIWILQLSIFGWILGVNSLIFYLITFDLRWPQMKLVKEMGIWTIWLLNSQRMANQTIPKNTCKLYFLFFYKYELHRFGRWQQNAFNASLTSLIFAESLNGI